MQGFLALLTIACFVMVADSVRTHKAHAALKTGGAAFTASSAVLTSFSSSYGCPYPSRYVPLSYLNQMPNECYKLGSWDIVRLAGGATLHGPGYGCSTTMSDVSLIGNTLCATWTVSNIKEGGTSCPSGTAKLSTMDGADNAAAFCSQIGQWDIDSLSWYGSISGSGYNCAVKDFDPSNLKSGAITNSMCGVITFQSIAEDGSDPAEVACGNGYSLITVYEAAANAATLSAKVPAGTIARLSGGGSIDQYGNVRDTDFRVAPNIFCAPYSRANVQS